MKILYKACFPGVFVLSMLAVMLVNCNPALAKPNSSPEAGSRVSLQLTAKEYPRIDGSTSTLPLQQYIAGELLGMKLVRVVAPYMSFSGEPTYTVVFPLAPEPQESLVSTEVLDCFRRIHHTGTNTAYIRLIRGDAAPEPKPKPGEVRPQPSSMIAGVATGNLPREGVDLILEARLPSEDELKFAAEKGVKLEIKPIALDAFVFIANRENPIQGLTTKQIQGIYTGKITDWAAVGGGAERIKAYQRERNSGSQELMKSLVMKARPMINAPEMIVMTMMGPFNALSQDKNGLSYSVFYYEEYMANRSQTKLLAVDEVMPSADTIRKRSYPYTTSVYAVIRTDLAKESPAYRLRDWLLSDEGQRVVARSGYVPARKIEAAESN